MDANTIKFKTIKYMNGMHHIPNEYVDGLKRIVCRDLNIEYNETNFKTVEEGIKIYFEAQNNIRLV